jgi:hypothetical protein
MSCGCDSLQICVAGKQYEAIIQYGPRGDFISGHYLDNNLVKQPLVAGTFEFGSCLLQPENELISGALAAPVAAPADPTERKLYINTTTNKITHWWNGSSWLPIPQADVFRVVQPLAAGNNVTAHSLGSAPVEVEVRNAATGATITATVVAEAINSVTIFVPVAVASARISVDA